jgi:hypothetical protein
VRNALYLVRPDGHVALADPSASLAQVEQYLDSRGLHPERPPAPGQNVEEHGWLTM